jgi:hypothetical protein
MKIIIVVSILFIVLTAIMTFPFVFKMDTHIPGTFDTVEPYNMLWEGWKLKYAFIKKINLNNFNFAAYPFGNSQVETLNYPIGLFIIKGLSIIKNEAFAYNFHILLSFLLSGLFMYFLVNYIFNNSLAAFLSGVIYAFCPYHFARSWQHFGLAQIQWMPLYILALFKLKEEKIFKNILLITFSFFVVSMDYTYAYFMIITTILFLAFIFINREEKQKNKIFSLFTISVILSFLITLPFNYIFYRNFIFGVPAEARGLYYRPFEDLFSQSARPLSYILPSSFHPIFGKFTQLFMGYNLYGNIFTEHTLYLGWVPLILAFIAVKSWRGRRSHYKLLVKNEDFYIGFFVVLAIVAWFFSQPPWWKIGTIKIYMPSFFMYKILPMYRAYCRFGIVVMLAVTVLAGFGLKFILGKFKTYKSKIALTCLFSSLVLFEFLNFPPFKVIDVSRVPQVYYWLKEQPRDIVIAEYPIDEESQNVMYEFYQTKHEKRIINATIPGAYANKVTYTIIKLSEPHTAEVLRWLGVKYVLVHKQDYLDTELIEWIEDLNNIPKNAGLKFIKSFPAQECSQNKIKCTQETGPIDVYEVIATASEPQISNK